MNLSPQWVAGSVGYRVGRVNTRDWRYNLKGRAVTERTGRRFANRAHKDRAQKIELVSSW